VRVEDVFGCCADGARCFLAFGVRTGAEDSAMVSFRSRERRNRVESDR
jgi:hypothetical protein